MYLIYCAVLLSSLLSINQASTFNLAAEPAEYGVDCSYPIHYGIDRKKCPYWYDKYHSMMEGCYRAYNKEECVNNENDRMRMNLKQAPSQHNYTAIGFKKIKAPKAAWEPLIKFYNENKANAKLEKWYRGNTIVNTWESPSTMVSFENPAFRGGITVKQQIWDGVKPIIEEWVGHQIEPTSLYGIRLYSGGSVLATRKFLVRNCIIWQSYNLLLIFSRVI